jgi:hypothetical protein
MPIGQTLGAISRLIDTKGNRLYSGCPRMLSAYSRNNDGAGAANSDFASFVDAESDGTVPNGAWPTVAFCNPTNGQVLAGNGLYAVSGIDYNFIDGIPVVTGTETVYPMAISFSSVEPLMVSPFLYATDQDDTGLCGVETISVTANVQGPVAGRVLRTVNAGLGGFQCSISNTAFLTPSGGAGPFQRAQLIAQFLSPNASVPLPAKSLVPMTTVRSYTMPASSAIPGSSNGQITSNALQLASIPDALLVFAVETGLNSSRGDVFVPTSNISATFENNSGLLANVSQTGLFQLSVSNGLTGVSWPQFTGSAWSSKALGKIRLSGAPVVLRFGKDIPLSATQAPGTAGTYSVQLQVTCQNPDTAAVTPTLFIVTLSSGFLESAKGQSRIITAPLTERDVVGAPMAAEGTFQSMQKMIGGGGLWDRLANAVSTGAQYVKTAQNMHAQLKPYVQQARQVVQQMAPEGSDLRKAADMAEQHGYGMSGGLKSGAGGYSKHHTLEHRLK